jgi:hypothetical protein
MIVVVGAAGSTEYGEQFATWADRWLKAAESNGVRATRVGSKSDAPPTDRDRLQDLIARVEPSPAPLWLVLIGHGVYDRRTARFNLSGLDVSADELSAWLADVKRPAIVVDCAAASGPFINRLTAPDRIVITAAKSGDEQSFARFGDYLSASIADPAADLDKDGQTSLLEAFLSASRQTAEFYASASRLATEHALLDDNGDGQGTGADFFEGVRATKAPKEGAALDGLRAHQVHLAPSAAERELPPELRTRRDEIERQVEALRAKKNQFKEDEYYSRLEPLLVELARIYSGGNSPSPN